MFKKTKNRLLVSKSDRVYYVINGLFLILILAVTAYPLIYIISASLSSSQAVVTGKVILWPVEFSLKGYKTVFEYEDFFMGYGNTIFYTLVGTTVNIIMTIMAAYPLSRKDLPFRKAIIGLYVFTMIFNGGLIPTYMLINNLGLIDKRLAMILPLAINVYNLIIAKSFFENNIPEELYESSQLDGCSYFKFFLKIVLPLSKPVIALLVLYYAIIHWNSYFLAFLYLNDRAKFPLQVILREILVLNTFNAEEIIDQADFLEKQGIKELLKYAFIVISSVPLMVLYPFISKHFSKGALTGSIKG